VLLKQMKPAEVEQASAPAARGSIITSDGMASILSIMQPSAKVRPRGRIATTLERVKPPRPT
jgi:hypothetical protein